MLRSCDTSEKNKKIKKKKKEKKKVIRTVIFEIDVISPHRSKF